MLSELPSQVNAYLTVKLLGYNPEEKEGYRKLKQLVKEGKIKKKTCWTFCGVSIAHYLRTEREVRTKVVKEILEILKEIKQELKELKETVKSLEREVEKRDRAELSRVG